MDFRAQKITFRGKVENRDAATPLLSTGGDVAVIERGRPRLLVMRCPCGCGDDLLINLDSRSGPAWRYYMSESGLSLYPSYWRDTACGSHFILWNNEIYWCSGWESTKSDVWSVSTSIEKTVLTKLPQGRFIKYNELADQLNLIPWEVLQACRQLFKQGKAIAAKYPRNGEFCKVPFIKNRKRSWFKSIFGKKNV